jgi:hypothetical protein
VKPDPCGLTHLVRFFRNARGDEKCNVAADIVVSGYDLSPEESADFREKLLRAVNTLRSWKANELIRPFLPRKSRMHYAIMTLLANPRMVGRLIHRRRKKQKRVDQRQRELVLFPRGPKR